MFTYVRFLAFLVKTAFTHPVQMINEIREDFDKN